MLFVGLGHSGCVCLCCPSAWFLTELITHQWFQLIPPVSSFYASLHLFPLHSAVSKDLKKANIITVAYIPPPLAAADKLKDDRINSFYNPQSFFWPIKTCPNIVADEINHLVPTGHMDWNLSGTSHVAQLDLDLGHLASWAFLPCSWGCSWALCCGAAAHVVLLGDPCHRDVPAPWALCSISRVFGWIVCGHDGVTDQCM